MNSRRLKKMCKTAAKELLRIDPKCYGVSGDRTIHENEEGEVHLGLVRTIERKSLAYPRYKDMRGYVKGLPYTPVVCWRCNWEIPEYDEQTALDELYDVVWNDVAYFDENTDTIEYRKKFRTYREVLAHARSIGSYSDRP